MNTTGNEQIDPMPVRTLGMWLFLASEAMFFVGLLGAFIVLKSAGGQHELFTRSSHVLSNAIGLTSAALLLVSSVSLTRLRLIALAAGIVFLILQAVQWRLLFQHDDGPWQNNFFGCYFLLSAVHCLHLIAGMITLMFFTIGPGQGYRRRLGHRNIPEAVQIYWHFVNAVGAVTFAALYFV